MIYYFISFNLMEILIFLPDLGNNYTELNIPTDMNGSNLKIKIGEMKSTKNPLPVLSLQETHYNEDIKEIKKLDDIKKIEECIAKENSAIEIEDTNPYCLIDTGDIEIGKLNQFT